MNSFRQTALSIQRVLSKLDVLQTIELRLIKTYSGEEPRPTFIIGAPRTGTTILYQLLLFYYHFAYITNIASLFIHCPARVTKLTEHFRERSSISFESEYGYIKGLFSPSEAGSLMRRWFDSEFDYIKQTKSSISQIMNGPFLCKNLNNSLRIDKIITKLPKANFLWTKRDPLYTAQSIIIARRKSSGTKENQWFSVKPRNYEQIVKLGEFEQVIYQIKIIDENIKKDIILFNLKKRIQEVNYDDLCTDFRAVLNGIEIFFKNNGLRIKTKKDKTESMPMIIPARKQVLDDVEWERLVSTVKQVYSEPANPV